MKRVLVIGDVIADVYRDCFFKKMCPDAPSVKAIVTRAYDLRPGGAANVAVNLAALAPDVHITLIGILDEATSRMIKFLSHSRVRMDHAILVNDPLRKERISLDGETLLRVDSAGQFSKSTAEMVASKLREYLAKNDPDLVVMSDYGAGTINGDSLDMLLSMRERLLVDTKMTDLSVFGSDGKTRLIKLNYDEWKAVTATEAAPERFFQAMVMTRGGSGAYLSIRKDESGRSVTHTLRVPAISVEVVDVCGCGDTFLAGLAASLLKNDDDYTAMLFANAAAATVVAKSRTAVADREQALRMLGWGEMK